MKNPHGIEPTRFLKRKESEYAIRCDLRYGPIFGNDCDNFDICIYENCNKKDSCCIFIDGTKGYECHPQYKKSLFVNTAGPDNRNAFNVLDYEVFTH